MQGTVKRQKNGLTKYSQTNQKLTPSDIQKDIVCSAATKTRNEIVNDFGDEFFAIMADESQNVSTKEMAVVLHYVDKYGHAIELIFGNLTC